MFHFLEAFTDVWCQRFRVDSSFFSSAVLRYPWFARIVLFLGLLASVPVTVDFFLGLEGSVSFTPSVMRFLDVRFLNSSPTLEVDAASIACSCVLSCSFRSWYLRTLCLVCSPILSLFFCSYARAISLFPFTFSFRSLFLCLGPCSCRPLWQLSDRLPTFLDLSNFFSRLFLFRRVNARVWIAIYFLTITALALISLSGPP